ncbi:MAG: SCO family protein [Acidobacteria bacterium]|nr:SCO family protein [Acidobacteriota bacterium]
MKRLTQFLVAAAALTLCAQVADMRTPEELQGVAITEHLGERVDLNLSFIAEDGYPHKLAEYFSKGRPVILNLVYYTCPMLCNLVLNGQTDAMRQLPWTAGNEFEVVTISIDPTENYGLAKNKKAVYLSSYDRETSGWHFLTDHEGNVAKLARQVGFGYKLDPKTGQYAHAAAIFVLSPDGMVSRYLYGVRFKPLDLRLALTEAAGGKFGLSERILLYCFHYDPASKSYVPFARNFMRFGGVLAMLALGFVLYRLWRRERLNSRANRLMVTAK